MRIKIHRILIASVCVAGLSLIAVGCACMKSAATEEREVTLAAVSAPARVTIEKETAGGRVEKITRETERGKIVYDVEATVGGKHMEYLVAEGNGELLGTEVPAEFGDLEPLVVIDRAIRSG